MEFKDAEQVQQICWEMRCADWPRSVNRTRINELMNGHPPYSGEEVKANNININTNFLEGTRLAHDARMQAQMGILKPGNYFSARTDAGPGSKRTQWNKVATQAINTPMKASLSYYENVRSKIASNILHGIGPSCWENDDKWCPDPLGVEDLLIPANTYLTFKNLPFFCILRSFTAPELIKLTRGTKVDKAWNTKLVDQCLKWIDRESMALLGSNWPEVWSAEKLEERVKGDGGHYMGDQVPTVDAFDFYYWSDQEEIEGWRRRIVLDDWSTPASAGGSYQFSRNSKLDFGRNQWLYNSKARVFADRREDIFTCTFADLSAVAPFRYHSVRSLGFLLYSICHLQNRLRSKFSESVFEALLMYFRVRNADEAERVIKLELANKGFIDDSVEFIKAADRYQVNTQLVELGLKENQQIIDANASGWTQAQNSGKDRTQKTKFQVMAEVQSATTLVNSALQQFFTYQTVEYKEIFKRFLNPHSRDIEVIQARKRMMREIPEKYLVPDAWEIDAERTLGAGNKTLEMAQAEQLSTLRPQYDPESQRKILRDITLAITDDPARAEDYVPDQPHISDSIHDTELAFGALMQGGMVSPRPGLNAIEVVGRMLQLMEQKIQQLGELGTKEGVVGLQLCAQYVQGFLQILAQDPEQKKTAAQMAQILSKLMNLVKAMAQRQQEQAQKQAQQGNGADPAAMAKAQAAMMQAKIKGQNARESHGQKTAQRQIQFEQGQRQDAAKAKMELQKKAAEAKLDLRKKAMETHLDLTGEQMKQRMKSDKGEE